MKVTESKEELLTSPDGGVDVFNGTEEARTENFLTPTEKKFLLFAERGDVPTVRR